MTDIVATAVPPMKEGREALGPWVGRPDVVGRVQTWESPRAYRGLSHQLRSDALFEEFELTYFVTDWPDEDWTKILAMAHATDHESLERYFVHLNRHLLGDVAVVEVIEGSLTMLAGTV